MYGFQLEFFLHIYWWRCKIIQLSIHFTNSFKMVCTMCEMQGDLKQSRLYLNKLLSFSSRRLWLKVSQLHAGGGPRLMRNGWHWGTRKALGAWCQNALMSSLCVTALAWNSQSPLPSQRMSAEKSCGRRRPRRVYAQPKLPWRPLRGIIIVPIV